MKTRRWVPFGVVSSIGLGVAAVLTAGTLASVGSAAPASAVAPRVPSKLSGMPWASGSFMPDYVPSAQKKFGEQRGARSDVALTYSGRVAWSEIEDPAWLWEQWKNAPQTLVISSAPFPETGGWSLAACA